MSTLMRRGRGGDVARQLSWMDRVFDEWLQAMPMRPLISNAGWGDEGLIRVDEHRDGDTAVIRAELPGIDPDKDVELTVGDGMLQIKAERRVEEKTQEKGFTRREMRYGTFSRLLPLPDGVTESDITATYKDGILEVRVPLPKRPEAPTPTKIAITKS
jgi:HSP20 family protein